jgi:hypothetical protein
MTGGPDLRLWAQWLRKTHSWPTRLQRDFMSRSAARQARVRAVADTILQQIESHPRGQDHNDHAGS